MEFHDEQLNLFFRPGKGVRPSDAFMQKSLGLILSRSQRKPSLFQTIAREFLENIQFSLALGLAAAFVVVALGGFSQWGSVIPGSTARNNQELLSEAAALEFSIELEEARYFVKSADTVAIMVDSLKNSETNDAALRVILEDEHF